MKGDTVLIIGPEVQKTAHLSRKIGEADVVLRNHGDGTFSISKDRNGGDAGRRLPWDDLPSRIKTATEAPR